MTRNEAIKALANVSDTDVGKNMTNADCIRAMSDEELAEILYRVGYDNGWLKPEYALLWLQRPAGEGEVWNA